MKKWVIFLLATSFMGLVTEDAFSQRRRRGSVRYSRPDGAHNRTTRRGGSVQSTQTTQGNRRTTQSTATTRRGETVTSTRNVTREDDKVKLEGQAQSSTGASREVSKEVQFDEGRIEKVERESTATGRYGEKIEREAEIKREGYGVASFEGEAKTSTGRKAEVEGVAGYGAYGRRGVVADVDTKYRGDWTTVAGRGRYGAAVTRLPQGYRPYTYYGRSYYHYGYAYYRPYYYGGVPYYWMMPPPYGVMYTTVPAGAVVVSIGVGTYYYADHVCYKETMSQGSVSYEVTPVPAGLETKTLPPERASVTVAGTTYYYYKNTFYREAVSEGQRGLVVVTKPNGVQVLEALPAEFEIEQTPNGASYFKYQETYYMPYLEPQGNEVYIVVDKPTAVVAALPENTALAERSINIPSGTVIAVRTASELNSAKLKPGDRFYAFLDKEIRVGQLLAAPKGAKVYGVVSEVEQAGSMSGQSKMTLRPTDIEVNGKVVPLVGSSQVVQGASEGKDTTKKVASGAAIGALIGAVADGGEGALWGAAIGAGAGTAASAATKGRPASLPAQSRLSFTLQQPLAVPIFVKVDNVSAE